MYLLTTLAALVVSGLVQIIAYIKLLTADTYGTSDMRAFSSSIVGLELEVTSEQDIHRFNIRHVKPLQHLLHVLGL